MTPLRFLLLILLLLPACVHAQRTTPGVKVTTPPRIDGKVEPGEWDAYPAINAGFDEETGAPNPDPQTFWLAYDEKYIYFAAKLADKEPGKIHAVETRMNVNINQEDHVLVGIDPFGNMQNLNVFRVNALGAAQLQIAGGRAAKREWVGEILSAGRITAEGWEVEARVPWAIMQLPAPGKRTLRADFGRYIHRTGRAYIASNIAGEQMQNFAKWSDVDVPKVTEKRILKLLPYGYGGWSEREGWIAQGGLDFKSAITEGLELVGTVSPDFRNIENDVLSLDFSYFERLAGESRPFFLEGAQYFQTSGDAPIFASQRISVFDKGLKIYGNLSDRVRVAFLDTVNFGKFNGFVGNVHYQIAPREDIKFAGTHYDRDGLNNSTQFVSYFRGMGNYGFFGQWSTSEDDQFGGGHRFNPGFLYEGNGMNGFIEYQEISGDYLPRLGFAPQRDFKGWNAQFEMSRQHRHPQIMETEIGISGAHQNRFNGDPFRRLISGNAGITLRDNTELEFSAAYQEINGFKDHIYEVELTRPRGNQYRNWQIGYAWGNVAGHPFHLFSPSFAYRPIRNLQIRFSHEELDHIERESQTILGLNWEYNRYESFSGRLLKRDDDINFYLAWRRAGNRGIEYYVILGDPNARKFETSIIVKAVVPIEVVLGK